MACTQIVIEDLIPTLQISDLSARLASNYDMLEVNRYGVLMTIVVIGTGTGNLKIDWGTDYSETKIGLKEGTYEFSETLPPGTHNICGVLFNVVQS